MSLTTDELLELTHELAADTERWQPYVRHDPDERTFHLIWEDENANAWVLCWSRDHDTGFHDHDASQAAIVVLEGEVREDRLRLDGLPTTRVVESGSDFTVPSTAIHRVLHSGDRPAVTIHAYSPPLTRMGSYAIGDNGELVREARDGASAVHAELSGREYVPIADS